MTVEIAGTRDRRLVADVRRIARRVGRDMSMGSARVNVIFCSNPFIHDLNQRFLKRDRPTDVMAFPLQPPNPRTREPLLLGEIYVSRDQARIQAREYGASYSSELRRLVLHGLLHLCGLTHRQMEPLYRRYLEK